MKRLIMLLLTAAAILSFPALLPQAEAEIGTSAENGHREEFLLRTGINLTPGLFYNWSWDPAYSGSAASVSLFYDTGSLRFGAGIEAGYSCTGLNLLFPLQAEALIAGDEMISLSAYASVLPGMIMTRPAPYFLLAVEAGGRLAWRNEDGFELSLLAAPRFTWSPDYSALVAPLQLLDLNIGIRAGFPVEF